MTAREWQFDGLVGPTHNYAGLATGNLAAAQNKGKISNPRAAALQGLEKMRFVRNLGMPQAFLPPHYRPAIWHLRRLGFDGSLGKVLDDAARVAPGLLASVYSSSFMWAANAATVTPSPDNYDNKLHFTPANLVSHFHRAIEAEFSGTILARIFHNHDYFTIHNHLTTVPSLGDEGAANHMRICSKYEHQGFSIFVYGKGSDTILEAKKFVARQERHASEAVARLHGIKNTKQLYLQQSPEVIDRGVFHNDVIAMNTGSLMIVHEDAFVPEHRQLLHKFYADHKEYKLHIISPQELTVPDAVGTYLFNSQLLEPTPGRYILVAPSESGDHAAVRAVIARLQGEGVLTETHYLDVRESMRNGGGPACLRLRVVMTPEQEGAMHQGIILTDERLASLQQWVSKHYRDRLEFDNLRDPQFVKELDAAYSELEAIIALPGLYGQHGDVE